jgi:hypothetical protein
MINGGQDGRRSFIVDVDYGKALANGDIVVKAVTMFR